MVRITLWFLATVAAVNLASTSPVPGNDGSDGNADSTGSEPRSVGETPLTTVVNISPNDVSLSLPEEQALWLKADTHMEKLTPFEIVHTRLDLPRMELPFKEGPANKAGLRILLEGAHVELLVIVKHFWKLYSFKSKNFLGAYQFAAESLPNLFQDFYCHLPAFQPFKNTRKSVFFPGETNPPNGVTHNLANLGLTSNVDEIITVIEGFISMLKDGDLLANFKAIVKDVSTRQQGSHSVGSTVQAPAESNPLPPQTYREYMYRFWLEVICGNKLEKLRHYLGHLLAFQVIPGMIYQMLEFGWNAKALKLAAQVSHVQAFKWVVNLFTQNPPNYFEFIIMYALKRRPENFEDLIHAAYRDMGGEDDEKKAVIQTLYNCHKRFDSSHWEILGTMFGLTAHPDYSTYQYNTDVFCRSRLWKYVQDFELTNESYGAILTAKDVDISTLGIPEDG